MLYRVVAIVNLEDAFSLEEVGFTVAPLKRCVYLVQSLVPRFQLARVTLIRSSLAVAREAVIRIP